MLDELADEEVDWYLEEHPKIVMLFEVNVVEAVMLYVTSREKDTYELDSEVIQELQQALEALEKERAMSQHVKASTLEDINLNTIKEPRPVNVVKEMPLEEKTTMVGLLKEFKDVFAWLYKDMRGLDPKLHQHHIHLNKDAKSVTQRRC